MPIFKQEIREIILPESGAKLQVYTKFSYGMILEIQNKEVGNDNDAKLEMAVLLINDWDFEDENKQKVEINLANLKSLSSIDGMFIITEMNKLLAEKKNLTT
jgi:hypothetical protein